MIIVPAPLVMNCAPFQTMVMRTTMEEMNRRNDQGLGLLWNYNMLFIFCTELFCKKKEMDVKNSLQNRLQGIYGEVPSRFELENKGFADLRLTTWLWHRKKMER